MANINEYLLWRGDLPINAKYKFNEIDSMLLARFSYLIFGQIDMKPQETIGSIAEKMKNFSNEDFIYNGDKEMITNLGQSERFKDMLVTDFREHNDKQSEKQFGAITIHPSSKEMYISYIGTDMSIYGWKEDFNMAFMDNVPCQIEGKEYAEEIAKKFPDKKIRIGGHSKGGNVAIFSAIAQNQEIQERIIKVYNYDGPGFNKKIIEKYGNNKIVHKIETYIPQDSVVGRLLNHKEKTTIVLSTEKGILQHDIFSWQVLKDDMIRLEKNTKTSEDIDKTLTDWLEVTTEQQRKIVVDAVFEILYSTEESTFSDMSKNLSTNLPKIFKKYGEISKEDKEMMSKMIKIILTSYMSQVKKRSSSKWDEKKEEYMIKGKTKLKEFDQKYLKKFRKEEKK